MFEVSKLGILVKFCSIMSKLDMNGTHQVLAYADDVNLIGDDIRTIERNTDVLLNACKDWFRSKHREN